MTKEELQIILSTAYNRKNWFDILLNVFSKAELTTHPRKLEVKEKIAKSALELGSFETSDGRLITLFEVHLNDKIIIERNRVALRNLLKPYYKQSDGAFAVYVQKGNWRFSFISEISKKDINGEWTEYSTTPKRYTYVLGEGEKIKTARDRFYKLLSEPNINLDDISAAFSVEKLSKEFFTEYIEHYKKFVSKLNESEYKDSVFNNNEKQISDFVKKLLGRIIFLYFIQKKGWLGASDIRYKDGNENFLLDLFKSSDGSNFYNDYLSPLFFNALNNSTRKDEDFKLPDGRIVKIPFLNGGLFDKEFYDNESLSIDGDLFHNSYSEIANRRGFFDFLNSYNFTIYEDDPNDHTVAVDPEMLGHIFENLLEDNKEKGAYYTPKEIVHYMCQESLIEYLTTNLSNDFTVYREIGNDQIEMFGNESRIGQLLLLEEMGDKALNRSDVENIVKNKDIRRLTKDQLKKINKYLDAVKICDPAIGSGAFPMGLLQEIHSIKEVIAYELGEEWKPAEVKENIIQNSIYGVDIEKGAVDIARLRFWLSLVVDEDKPRPLPNLDYKIVVGNSLVSKIKFDDDTEMIVEIDWNRILSSGDGQKLLDNIQKLLNEIPLKQKLFFNSGSKKKESLKKEIRNLKLDLLINKTEFDKFIFKSRPSNVLGIFELTFEDVKQNSLYEKRLNEYSVLIEKLQKIKEDEKNRFVHFDWKLDFPEVLNELINPNPADCLKTQNGWKYCYISLD